MKAHQRKVQKRVRKGIPDQLRGLVWQLLSGGRDLALRNEGICSLSRTQAVLSPAEDCDTQSLPVTCHTNTCRHCKF